MTPFFISARSRSSFQQRTSNRIELSDVIGPGEFDLKSASSSIITDAPNLNVFHRLTFDVQRFDAVLAVTHPMPAASAPMKIRIEIDIHFGSMNVCSRMSPQTARHLPHRTISAMMTTTATTKPLSPRDLDRRNF